MKTITEQLWIYFAGDAGSKMGSAEEELLYISSLLRVPDEVFDDRSMGFGCQGTVSGKGNMGIMALIASLTEPDVCAK